MESGKPIYRQFNLQQLEREYSPSSCVEDLMVYINQYIEESARQIELANQMGCVKRDLRYGDDEDETLDLFLPTTNASGKLQVYIHGGYWQELSKNESAFAAQHFQQQGHHMAVVNYSLAPKANLTEIVEQNRRAIAWLIRNADQLGFDKSEIYLSGSSAGGHLVLMMLATQWQKYGVSVSSNEPVFKGACAVSAVVDLEPIKHTYVNEPLQLSEREIETLSPIKLSFDVQCPLIIAYGDNETSEFKRQSNDMAKYLRGFGWDVELQEVANRNHFDVVMDLGKKGTWLNEATLSQMKGH